MNRKYWLLLDPLPEQGGIKQNIPNVKGTTPEQPKEPPKEVLSQTFSMDPGLLSDNGATKVTVDDKTLPPAKPDEKGKSPADTQSNVDASKGNEPKKPDAQPDTKESQKTSILKPPGSKTGDDKSKVIPAAGKVQRDYNGYSADVVKVLKQMSDEAYAYTTDLIKKNAEGAKNKDSLFLQHPNAYVLSEDYQNLQGQVNLAQQEASIYQDQLATVKAGNPIKEFLGFDPKTRKPVYGNEIQPTDKIEESLRLNLMQVSNIGTELSNKVKGYGTQYQQQVQRDLQAVENERAAKFPWVKDPAIMDYTISVEGQGDKSVRQIQDDFTGIIPQYFRNHPMTKVAADLMTALMISHAEIQQLKSSQTVTDTKLQEIARGEPSSDSRKMPEKKAINGVREFSLAGMPA